MRLGLITYAQNSYKIFYSVCLSSLIQLVAKSLRFKIYFLILEEQWNSISYAKTVVVCDKIEKSSCKIHVQGHIHTRTQYSYERYSLFIKHVLIRHKIYSIRILFFNIGKKNNARRTNFIYFIL